MKKNLLTLALCALVLCSCSSGDKIQHYSYNEGINIIPQPVELTQSEGSFTINANTVLVPTSELAAQSVAYLASKIKSSTGYNLTISKDRPTTNFIEIGVNPELGIKKEGYTLTSTTEGVVINGVDDTGAFYGVQTLLQLLPAQIESTQKVTDTQWALPLVAIKDSPRYEYRGIMLDVCRHFMDVDFLKKQLDVFAMFKINSFHWHLTEDQAWRIEIKKYPLLTELGSIRTEGDGSTYGPFFYTQEQIRDVVAYATERHIDVVPEIELPGHALAALVGYPEYSCTGGPFDNPRNVWGVEEDVFCAGNDKTFEFLEDVIDEVITLFPSQYIHIGGDECPKVKWENCPKCQARIAELGIRERVDPDGARHTKEEQLQSYFISRIGEYIQSKGKKFIGWDEILEGGLADGAMVMSWRGVSYGATTARLGHQCIMTPNTAGFYLDHYQGACEVEEGSIGGYAPWTKLYGFEAITDEYTPEMEEMIIGIQGNMWTEYRLSDESVEYMIYPRVLAIAEVNWLPKGAERNTEDFARRLYNGYARLDYHGVNYHVPMAEGVLSRNVVYTGDSVVVEFTNTQEGLPMVYTLDGSEPTTKSTKYIDPIVVKDGSATIKIASMLPTGKLSVSRTIPVGKESLSPAAKEEGDNNNPKLLGLREDQVVKVRTANGLFTSDSEFTGANFGEEQYVESFRGVEYDYKKPSLNVFEGYIELPEDGVYTFATDMAQLYIDDVLIISNSEVLSRHLSHKVQKALAAGKHKYKFVVNNYIQDGWPHTWEYGDITFYYQLPSGGNFVRVTPAMLSL